MRRLTFPYVRGLGSGRNDPAVATYIDGVPQLSYATADQMLLDAEERTEAELDSLRRHFIQQGLTPQQAHGRAWEIVRERYLFLPPETPSPRRKS